MVVAEELGDFGGAALVVDGELGGGGLAGAEFLVGVEFHAAAFDGAVEVVGAGAGVAAGFGVGSGGHVGDAEGEEGVTEGGGFAGGDDDADLREGYPEGAEELDHLAVGEGQLRVGLVEVVAGVGAHAGEGDRELGFPAGFEEELQVGGEGESFPAPVGEAEEGADTDAAESAGIGAFGAFEAPFKVLLGAGGVEFAVGFLVIALLVDDEAFRAGLDELGVLVVLHRSDLDAEGGNERFEGIDAFLEIAVGDEFRVFSGHEEDVSEPLGVEVAGFLDDLIDGQGRAEDGVISGKPAILTIIDAFVGEIEGGKHPHGRPEMASGQGGAAVGQSLQTGVGKRLEMAFEPLKKC